MPNPAEGVRIEAMTSARAAAVLAIYQAGIEEGNATFETRAPDWQGFTAARLARHRYVAVDAGIWTIQSGIFPENTASMALHRTAGFRIVGTRERIGQHHGQWRDVILIERRSQTL